MDKEKIIEALKVLKDNCATCKDDCSDCLLFTPDGDCAIIDGSEIPRNWKIEVVHRLVLE